MSDLACRISQTAVAHTRAAVLASASPGWVSGLAGTASTYCDASHVLDGAEPTDGRRPPCRRRRLRDCLASTAARPVWPDRRLPHGVEARRVSSGTRHVTRRPDRSPRSESATRTRRWRTLSVAPLAPAGNSAKARRRSTAAAAAAAAAEEEEEQGSASVSPGLQRLLEGDCCRARRWWC
jgi:hypothetical protein